MRFILAVVVAAVVVGMRASLCPLFAPIHTKRRFYFLKSFLIVCQMGQCEADRRHLIRAQPRFPSPFFSLLTSVCSLSLFAARSRRGSNAAQMIAIVMLGI